MKSGYLVGDAMTTKPVICLPDMTLKNCAVEMKERNVGSILVVENGELAGIVTEEDFVYKAAVKGFDVDSTVVRDIMSTDLITVSPTIDIVDAIKKMDKFGVRHLPVLEDDRIVGFITLQTILKLEPQLMDLLAERIELRGIHPKSALHDSFHEEFEGVCSSCGNYSSSLTEKDGELLCSNCLKI